MNAWSIEHHGRQLDFLCDADRVVFVREDAGSASNTEASILLYQSYITSTGSASNTEASILLYQSYITSSTGNTEVN